MNDSTFTPSMQTLPSGTVTFLFTDIEGSTKRWEHQPQAMKLALKRHDALLRDAIEANGGYVFKTVGDAFCAAFPSPTDALSAALVAQSALNTEQWGESGTIKVRMALHTGTAEEWDGDYFGPPVNRVARLLSAGHGGQTLLSQPTYELLRDQLPASVQLLDFGERRLKDLIRSELSFRLSRLIYPSISLPSRRWTSAPTTCPPNPLSSLVGRMK